MSPLDDTTNSQYFCRVISYRWAVGLAVIALSTSCAGTSAHQAVTSSPPPSATRPAAALKELPPGAEVARVSVGTSPCAVVGAFGAVWVSLYGDDQVIRLDPQTRAVRSRTPTGAHPCGLAVGAGSVWVENYGDGTVTRVDGRTGRVLARPHVGSSPYDVTFSAGAAWVTNYGDNTVSRVDARINRVRTFDTGEQPTGVAPAAGAVWVTNQGDGRSHGSTYERCGRGRSGSAAIRHGRHGRRHRLRCGWRTFRQPRLPLVADPSCASTQRATSPAGCRFPVFLTMETSSTVSRGFRSKGRVLPHGRSQVGRPSGFGGFLASATRSCSPDTQVDSGWSTSPERPCSSSTPTDSDASAVTERHSVLMGAPDDDAPEGQSRLRDSVAW